MGIAQKIGYGYALTIGIATLGVSFGLFLGDTYEREALRKLNLANHQRYLLGELEKQVLKVQSHPQRLVSVLGDSIWFGYETEQFSRNVNSVKNLTQELVTFSRDNADNIAINPAIIGELADGYTTVTAFYRQYIEGLWQELDPANLKTAEEIETAQQQLFTATNNGAAIRLRIQFERLDERLIQSLGLAEKQYIEANSVFSAAQKLRLQVILASILLSVFVATILAFWTSRILAYPLKAATQTAEQIIQEANFNLRVPIYSQDEVASLAKSFNQFIQWVEQYTQELKQAMADLKKTQLQLIQSEKMSSLGQLVAGVAHEINNPVNFIHGNLTHIESYARDLLDIVEGYQECCPNQSLELQEKIEDKELDFLREDLPKLINSMRVGTERIREIVKSLRNFSRLDESDLKVVDLHEGIDNTLMILRNRFQANSNLTAIEIFKDYGELPPLECYAGQLNQVVMNILSNAIDALEEQRKLAIATAGDSAPTIRIRTELIENGQVAIYLEDNGPGMLQDVSTHIFDPFFTTKPVGKGTGLGLSISYQIIVENHKGKLECQSRPDRGTTFIITIPLKQR